MVHAYILIQTEVGKAAAVAAEISGIPGVATAGLLVFVEVLKELPATALLRPLGGDTLAIAVWEATKESRFDVAALPALLIVVAGLVPVVAAIRLARG